MAVFELRSVREWSFIGFIVLAIVGFWRADERLHLLLPIAILASSGVYVGALFLRLA